MTPQERATKRRETERETERRNHAAGLHSRPVETCESCRDAAPPVGADSMSKGVPLGGDPMSPYEVVPAARAAAPPVEPRTCPSCGAFDGHAMGCAADSPDPVAGLREADADNLRGLATWFDHFDDWREATGKIAPGITDYREVQEDLRRIAALLASDKPGLDAATNCLDYDSHRWNNNGSPSFCRDCGIDFPTLSAKAGALAARIREREA